MAIATNRVALSTIRDTQLNSSTPLTDKYKRVSLKRNNDINKLISLTPSKFKKRTPDLITRSFSIEKSGTYYAKTASQQQHQQQQPLRSVSFNFNTQPFNTPLDQSPSWRTKSSTSTSTTTTTTTTQSAFKNNTAGLAATKLKLKLQFALHKVKQRGTSKYSSSTLSYTAKKPLEIDTLRSRVSKTITSPLSSRKSTPNASPFFDPSYIQMDALASLPTPPEPHHQQQPQQKPQQKQQQQQQSLLHNYYTRSVNVNLQSVNKNQSATTSLSKVATNKTKKRNQRLRLFQIKKNSIYYTENKKKLPLISETKSRDNELNNKSTVSSENLQLFCRQSFLESQNTRPIKIEEIKQNETTKSKEPTPLIRETNILPSINLYGSSSSSASSHFYSNKNTLELPPISKILKTPLKRANFAKSFRFQQSFDNAAPAVIASRTPTVADDTTIEEDNDMTLIQNSTIYNSTIDQQENTTINQTKDGDETKVVNDDDDDDDDDIETKKAKKEKDGDAREDREDQENDEYKPSVLTSSPFNNHLGTPNSFSVAKSLLQLGGHRM
ncbi:hypothetical protein PVL30_001333 [Lodderomyces elongisporus]|uniref:uncharacterized protein n=1 Tax=Lodderomyces elongisporus TaxID=36914 RepID=UPI00291E9190|nr:uncharacterized protein PVL30_001333 [Lodderomyces elongisporus]WLF77617.1 hypothetical protein PVL30_001333 [Lodderomyces elongisporus]